MLRASDRVACPPSPLSCAPPRLTPQRVLLSKPSESCTHAAPQDVRKLARAALIENLDIRGLDTSGNKRRLQQRLSQFLEVGTGAAITLARVGK